MRIPDVVGNAGAGHARAGNAAADEAALEAVRVAALGKKGCLRADEGPGALSPDSEVRRRLNLIKDKVSDAIALRKAALADKALNERLARETVDVTLPPR